MRGARGRRPTMGMGEVFPEALQGLAEADPEVHALVEAEKYRQWCVDAPPSPPRPPHPPSLFSAPPRSPRWVLSSCAVWRSDLTGISCSACRACRPAGAPPALPRPDRLRAGPRAPLRPSALPPEPCLGGRLTSSSDPCPSPLVPAAAVAAASGGAARSQARHRAHRVGELHLRAGDGSPGQRSHQQVQRGAAWGTLLRGE